MVKKGGSFEEITLEFLESIFQELNYEVVSRRIQKSGSQDGFDILVELVDEKNKHYNIYAECKDYSTRLNYTLALEKIPHIVSTHKKIDLLLFISPHEDFANTNEETKLESFYEAISDECPIEFLTPESYIKSYFALYPELYEKVYGKKTKPVTLDNRNKFLQKFKKLIFSDKNLKKIIINEDDKSLFIGKLEKDKYYIRRSFRKYQDRDRFIFDNPDYKIKIEEQLNKSKYGIVILGNPGSGKSHELENLSIQLWETRETNNKIPKFWILKNFNSETKFQNLLPSNYKYISNLVIILDGIDEIHNITDFTTKLKSFIFENEELIKKNNLKFVISCRTNIYNNHIKNIDGLDICFLNEIPENLAINFLLNKFGLDLTQDSRFSFWKFRDILQTPFYLELLGKHYLKTNEVLLNKSKLLETYVEYRLKEDEKIKYQNDNSYHKSEILEQSKKIALSMEAMQQSFISTGQSKKICGKSIDLSKNPFLQQNIDENWCFEHKNIQEYLVAKVLSDLKFEEIISFIQIDEDTPKIHPTWYNVISFLLNLDLPKNLYDRLTTWIISNNLKLIFQADFDRIIVDIRIKCLIEIFSKTCLQENLWIENKAEVAQFANSKESVDYLLTHAKEFNLHIRARLSSIQLLSYMDYTEFQISEIQDLIIQIISEFERDTEKNNQLLQEAFRLLQNPKICTISLYSFIITKLQEYDHREVVRNILTTMPTELIEENVDYLLDILDKTIGRKYWVYPSHYTSTVSTKDYVFELFLKIDNPKLLIKIYSFLVDRHQNHEIRESLIKGFLDYLKSVFIKHPEINNEIIEIISKAVIDNKIRYYEDDLLLEIVKFCGIEKEVFFIVLNEIKEDFSQKIFLAEIVNETFFTEILQSYKTGVINDDFLLFFRNAICDWNSIDLGIAFEKHIEKYSNYKFEEKIDKKEIEEKNIFFQTDRQREFDVLFDNKLLNKQILQIFIFKNKNELSFQDIEKFNQTYYKSYKLKQNVTKNALQVLRDILRDNYNNNGLKLKLKDIFREISKHQLWIMRGILSFLPKEKDNGIVVSADQRLYIEKWCLKNSEKAKKTYNKYFSKSEETPWNNKEYSLLNTVFQFQKYFIFNLDEEFLLDMILLNAKEKLDLEYIPQNFNTEKVTARIVKNLNSAIKGKSIYLYIKYLIDNNQNLNCVKFNIKDKIVNLLDNNNHYHSEKLIELLYCKDIDFISGLININRIKTREKHFLDFILNLLIKNENIKYVENYLVENYDFLIMNEIMEESIIIKMLINVNSEYGFKKLLNIIENQPNLYSEIENNFSYSSWQNYSNEKSIDDLLRILEVSITKEDIINLIDTHFSPIRISFESIISICQNQDSYFCQETLNKLNRLDTKNSQKSNIDLFYINKLKNDIQDIIYNHKSKAFDFKNTLELINKYDYIFY
ncbi:NACHT domain-containing NTPase [Chryseobacterium sp. BIGb0232]|uniref:NACHT domain-containing protein n=1 Tax=Chryseobacterium sp. BIGb0232 TaxID=2940598 RepID=UPI000F4ACDBF|nr:hypothetical protein [Chryseobacterium sp. BIGb0232]MCS4301807.1 hypothetical protein [Chryseobacterium sp. BIGb0232]ROS19341.1 hypothetical protein EDF65_0024 [Chryseobacterium nakagawai]